MADDLDLTEVEKVQMLRDLKEAYYSGAKRIRFRERDVTYRSDQEMRTAITRLELELAPKPRPRSAVTTFGNGL